MTDYEMDREQVFEDVYVVAYKAALQDLTQAAMDGVKFMDALGDALRRIAEVEERQQAESQNQDI